METGHGGKRPGAGRRLGAKNQSTLKRDEARTAVLEVIQRETLAELGPMLRAQIELAKGAQVMLARDADGRYKRVTDPAVMETLLNTADKVSGVDYYLIAAKDADPRAWKDLVDRIAGRATEHVELEAFEELTISWEK